MTVQLSFFFSLGVMSVNDIQIPIHPSWLLVKTVSGCQVLHFTFHGRNCRLDRVELIIKSTSHISNLIESSCIRVDHCIAHGSIGKGCAEGRRGDSFTVKA